MDSDRPGGDAGRPGNSPSDFGEWTAAQHGGRASPPDQPPAPPGAVPSGQRPRFTVQSGGSFSGAAERGGDAQSSARRGSHGLEVVPVAEHSEVTRENQPDPPPEDDVAARMMREIEEEVAEIRRQFAGRLISLQRPNEPPGQDLVTRSGPLAPCGVFYEFFFRVQERVRRLASEKPMQTAAALVAIGLAFGVALRLRK